MDLLCPHCTRRITVPDDKAGLVLNCPLCAKQFMAPSLPPAAPPPPPPVTPLPPAPGTYGVAPPTIGPVSAVPPAPLPIEPAAPPKPPPPPLPPGEYRAAHTLHLRGDYLAFVPVACLALIFGLTFFTWHMVDANTAAGLWGLAFAERNWEMRFLAYFLVFVVCVFLAVMSLLFEKQLIFIPPQMEAMKPFLMYKDLLVALFLGIDLIPLAYDYVDAHFIQSLNPIGLALKLVIRLHFLALVASLLLFWLHWRKTTNLPPPKCEVRW